VRCELVFKILQKAGSACEQLFLEKFHNYGMQINKKYLREIINLPDTVAQERITEF
jgi:hypothetical protein